MTLPKSHLHLETSILQKLSWEGAITPIIIGGFYPKSNLNYILLYIPVYKIWIKCTNFWKTYQGETIFHTHRQEDEVEKGP